MIDYVEFASADPQAMCAFFEATLGWSFEWFGPDYVAGVAQCHATAFFV